MIRKYILTESEKSKNCYWDFSALVEMHHQSILVSFISSAFGVLVQDDK